jgi:methionine-rich copper-binding protein CopC
MTRTRRWLAGAALLLGAASGHGAAAHAFLDHARPAVGAVVAAAPDSVQLWFTEPLEPAFSTVQVVGPSGERVDQGKPSVGGDDSTELRIGVRALAPGRYKVIWRVLSVDSHVTNGDFSFTVGR